MTAENSQSKKVLIVDDDEFLLEMYALKFRQSGFAVDVAENGKKALEKITESAPDILLLDVVMPSVDGFQVLQEIKSRKLAPNAIVIMLTNLGQKDDTERGISLGADDYVVKAHFTPSEVVEKVRKVLEKR
jgi:DNA-binding response OmpR family regulator